MAFLELSLTPAARTRGSTLSYRHNAFSRSNSRLRRARRPARTRIPGLPRASAAGDDNGAHGGTVLSIADLTLQAGTRDLVQVDNWSITPGVVCGIVGANGAGKSTMLRAIAAADEYPRSIRVGQRASVGYLPQQAVSGSFRSVWEEAGSEMNEIRRAEERMSDAEARLDGSPESSARLERAMENYRRAGGYDQDEKIGRVLTGLGFSKEDWNTPCSELSGGWQMRVALARLLLSEPTLLLLDEPTNHLDSAAKQYLQRFLRDYPHTVILVSHDVNLLDACCSRIAEIQAGKWFDYAGCNYTRYIEEKSMRMMSAERAEQKKAAEAEKLQSFIDKFGAKATKASQAQSKQKALDKLLNSDPAGGSAGPSMSRSRSKMRMILPDAPPCAKESVHLVDADIGYPGCEPLISDVSLVLERGSRYAIVGANGCGKSTLLKTLAGTLTPLNARARRRVGDDRVSIGVFTQDLAADLPSDSSPLRLLEKLAPNQTRERLRSTLGALGLRDYTALREIGQLSGGEQARVALATFMVQDHNVLMLDEVTNHLDVDSVDTLCEALKLFKGSLVMVSHDRRLIENVATHCIVVDDKKAKLEYGVSESALKVVIESDDVGAAAGTVDSSSARNAVVQKEEASQAFQERRKEQKERNRAQKRLPAVEREIEELEARLPEIDADMVAAGTDVDRVMILHEQREEAAQRIDALYDEYEKLETVLAACRTS